jgi:hypothetical protein
MKWLDLSKYFGCETGDCDCYDPFMQYFALPSSFLIRFGWVIYNKPAVCDERYVGNFCR